jgi:6-phosphogluconolactonase
MHPHVVVASDAAALAEAGARMWVDAVRTALAARGDFHVALSGGRTPEELYRAVARSSDLDFAWHRTHVWWSDERAVPPNDERSNYGLAKRALLEDVPLPDAQVHRMRGEVEDLDAEARRYEQELASLAPVLDLVWLGVGEDGHVASLFPGSPGLEANGRAVIAADGPGGQPPRRISLTFAAINAARRVVIVAAGRAKSSIVARARAASAEGSTDGGLPVARVRPTNGHLVWLLDAECAGG